MTLSRIAFRDRPWNRCPSAEAFLHADARITFRKAGTCDSQGAFSARSRPQCISVSMGTESGRAAEARVVVTARWQFPHRARARAGPFAAAGHARRPALANQFRLATGGMSVSRLDGPVAMTAAAPSWASRRPRCRLALRRGTDRMLGARQQAANPGRPPLDDLRLRVRDLHPGGREGRARARVREPECQPCRHADLVPG